MSIAETEEDLKTDEFEYPPLLDFIVPGLILIGSLGYAWTLRGITNAETNLLMLRPLFGLIWIILIVVGLRETAATIRNQTRWRAQRELSARARDSYFALGTEAHAGMIVLATLVFSFFAVGNGALAYVTSLFVYLAVAGYLLGDRHLPLLIIRAASCTLGLYLILGVALDVRL